MAAMLVCRGSISLGALLAAIWVHGLVSPVDRCLAAGKPSLAAEDEAAAEMGIPPDAWQEVPPAEVLGIYQMLAARTRSNYERIQTWQAEYAFRSLRMVPQVEALGIGTNLAGAPLQQEIRYQLDVRIDQSAGAIYRATTHTALAWINADTLGPVVVPGTAVPNERVIVTKTHCLNMRPDETYASFQAVPNHPAAKNTRAAFRDSLKSAQARTYVSMPDPRQCFGRSDHRRLWEELEIDIAVLQGKQGQKKTLRLQNRLCLYRALAKGGTWYREDLLMDGPGDELNLARTFWSPEAGFHPVSFSLWQNGSRTRLLFMRKWSFKQIDGIYVPESMTETYFQGDKISRQRQFQLAECVLNRPIDPSQFSHAGLGLGDAELIMDRIEGVCYIIRDGRPEKLANFDAKYLPLAVVVKRWLMRLGPLGVAAAVLLILVVRRKARRRARHCETKSAEAEPARLKGARSI